MQVASPPLQESKTDRPTASNRLPEIDWFRALAICYMGLTHAEFHMDNPPSWAARLAMGGIYFCYVGFLMSFGMAQAIIRYRGLLLRPEGKARFLRQAGMILLGYYLIAFGGNYEMLAELPRSQLAPTILHMLLLLNVPKAGDFFLSFLLYLLLILAFPNLVSFIATRPGRALLGAMGLNILGNLLARHAPTAFSGWWKMVFGVQPSARTFPIFGYAPLLVFSIWLGWSYVHSKNRRRWVGIALLAALPVAIGGNLLCATASQEPWHRLAVLTPVPGLLYLLSASAVGTAVFCGVSFLRMLLPSLNASVLGRFLNFVGRHSFWIIVWQYLWIGFLMDALTLSITSSVATASYLLSIVFLPPLSLYLSQKLEAWYQSSSPNLIGRSS
ncbi:hypothetical protein CWRG_01315 [Chthonomonas calidirosea]|uniref:hypothetical protein n=1 Tax=Chthonomonas calidirosea TaxID=454171 RepID=UPI0006DD52CA|nr:hypothetical protein [Chthonomonas calidirosea]CEK15920.1 hypothetical protein CWRG_01315 [Chthonomonas calidirosea]